MSNLYLNISNLPPPKKKIIFLGVDLAQAWSNYTQSNDEKTSRTPSNPEFMSMETINSQQHPDINDVFQVKLQYILKDRWRDDPLYINDCMQNLIRTRTNNDILLNYFKSFFVNLSKTSNLLYDTTYKINLEPNVQEFILTWLPESTMKKHKLISLRAELFNKDEFIWPRIFDIPKEEITEETRILFNEKKRSFDKIITAVKEQNIKVSNLKLKIDTINRVNTMKLTEEEKNQARVFQINQNPMNSLQDMAALKEQKPEYWLKDGENTITLYEQNRELLISLQSEAANYYSLLENSTGLFWETEIGKATSLKDFDLVYSLLDQFVLKKNSIQEDITIQDILKKLDLLNDKENNEYINFDELEQSKIEALEAYLQDFSNENSKMTREDLKTKINTIRTQILTLREKKLIKADNKLYNEYFEVAIKRRELEIKWLENDINTNPRYQTNWSGYSVDEKKRYMTMFTQPQLKIYSALKKLYFEERELLKNRDLGLLMSQDLIVFTLDEKIRLKPEFSKITKEVIDINDSLRSNVSAADDNLLGDFITKKTMLTPTLSRVSSARSDRIISNTQDSLKDKIKELRDKINKVDEVIQRVEKLLAKTTGMLTKPVPLRIDRNISKTQQGFFIDWAKNFLKKADSAVYTKLGEQGNISFKLDKNNIYFFNQKGKLLVIPYKAYKKII